MDIDQIRHFVRVAEVGSYIRAADLLDMAQPTLSRQVRALEVELRATLFHRHGRGILLTDAGKRFLEHARAVLHTADAAVLAARESEDAYDGRLVIGVTPSVGRILLTPLLPQLKQRFPRASISVVGGLTGDLYNKVLLGEVDFAVVHNPAASPNLELLPLVSEHFYLVGTLPTGASRSSVTLAEVAALPLVLPNSGHAIRPALESAAARMGLRLNVIFEIDATMSIVDLVASGTGYGVMPVYLRGASGLPALHWQKIVRPSLETMLCMVSPVRWPRSPLPKEAALMAKNTLLKLLRTKKP